MHDGFVAPLALYKLRLNWEAPEFKEELQRDENEEIGKRKVSKQVGPP